jgi:VanZ family protein
MLLLLAVVWRPGRPKQLEAWLLPLVLGVVALGGLVEVLQGIVGRDADAGDWLADAVGAAVATAVFVALRSRSGASRRPGSGLRR